MILAECICADEISSAVKDGCAVFSQSDEDLFPLEDKRSTRAMSRMIILILHSLHLEVERLKQFKDKRIGIYAVCDVGPSPNKVFEILMKGEEQRYEHFKTSWPPKQLFKKDGGVIPAQISIYLESTGPAISFNNSDEGMRQALQTAKCDLASGWVDYALIAGAYSPEDPTLHYKATLLSSKISEGAGFLFFDKSGANFDVPTDYKPFYGHVSQLIGTIQMLKKAGTVDGKDQ